MKKLSFNAFIIICIAAVAGFLFFPHKASAPETTGSHTSNALKYVALGDSYTIGEGVKEADRWPNQLAARLSKDGLNLTIVANPSRTGYTTQDLLDKEIDVLKNSGADLITLQIGVNDYYQNVSEQTFASQFNLVLDGIKQTAPKAKLLIITIPDYGKTPYGISNGRPEVITAGVQNYNAIIKAESAKRSLPVADIFTISQTSSGAGNVAKDGLHPSPTQYTDWVTIIYPEALKLLKS